MSGETRERTRWERWHPLRAKRLRRCEADGRHRPVIVDGGCRKLCMNCYEWTRNGR